MPKPSKFAQYPGVSEKTTNGRTFFRHRAKDGKDTVIPGQPGSEEFDRAFNIAVASYKERAAAAAGDTGAEVVGLPVQMARTFGKAATRLEDTMEWKAYDSKTRKYNAMLIERFLETRVEADVDLTWRNVPVEYMTAKLLRSLIEDIFTSRKSTAKHTLNAIRKLLWVAIHVENWIAPENDPSLSIKVRPPKSTKNPAWPLSIREKFEARHLPGSAARTCYALAFWLGSRRGDVALLEWSDLDQHEIELHSGELVAIEAFSFRQGKNANKTGGAEMFIPLVSKLAEALAPINHREGTVLKTTYGKPFSEKSLTNQMAVWCQQAGIPAGYTMHGLRRTFGSYLAECNVEAKGIMTALGHSAMSVTDSYVRDANKKLAMFDIVQTINEREEKRDLMKRRGNLRIVR
ncbi:tyrosine-type recombinase/integrase [Rhizobium leguminosarum bv. viciae]|uniref:tyrosine-type recombinase/integrase n=1 Tax=Rhizobium leguminosarum TaxID=384 RepID=UPI00144139B4|nr:tyrosine-type recombinase/integrase [Rhizobium leguminosarum]NKK88736.1 tyrosine-type recombinase/integrase [Rhizobium leguminosarum bv. viciae]